MHSPKLVEVERNAIAAKALLAEDGWALRLEPNRHGDDHYTQYGWYENRFRREADGWKISRLKHTFQWCDGNPMLIDFTDPDWQAAAAEVFGA